MVRNGNLVLFRLERTELRSKKQRALCSSDSMRGLTMRKRTVDWESRRLGRGEFAIDIGGLLQLSQPQPHFLCGASRWVLFSGARQTIPTSCFSLSDGHVIDEGWSNPKRSPPHPNFVFFLHTFAKSQFLYSAKISTVGSSFPSCLRPS